MFLLRASSSLPGLALYAKATSMFCGQAGERSACSALTGAPVKGRTAAEEATHDVVSSLVRVGRLLLVAEAGLALGVALVDPLLARVPVGRGPSSHASATGLWAVAARWGRATHLESVGWSGRPRNEMIRNGLEPSASAQAAECASARARARQREPAATHGRCPRCGRRPRRQGARPA